MFGRFGELSFPRGVAIDDLVLCMSVSMIIIVSLCCLCLCQFVITSFGGKGKEPGKFKGPNGLVVDSSGAVCVCDSSNCIQVFSCPILIFPPCV